MVITQQNNEKINNIPPTLSEEMRVHHLSEIRVWTEKYLDFRYKDDKARYLFIFSSSLIIIIIFVLDRL